MEREMKQPVSSSTSPSDAKEDMTPSQVSSSASWRQALGRQMHTVSDSVNEHLIIARYATFASVTLLAAYGISHTPLFFRYHTVNDIPASMFTKRRTIQCRLVRVAVMRRDKSERSIRLWARHVSPIGRLMSRSAYDSSLKMMQPSTATLETGQPSTATLETGHSTTTTTTEDSDHIPPPQDVLELELAGVELPPSSVNKIYLSDLESLRMLAKNETMVRCQLLGRRRTSSDDVWFVDPSPVSDPQQAVVRITFRQSPNAVDTSATRQRWRLFGIYTDVAGMLLQQGEVRVSSSGLFVKGDNSHEAAATDDDDASTATTIQDCSTNVKDLRQDVTYMENLAADEAKAARDRHGLWADPTIQQKEEDLLEEVDFQKKATFFQKLWRRIRHGGYS